MSANESGHTLPLPQLPDWEADEMHGAWRPGSAHSGAARAVQLHSTAPHRVEAPQVVELMQLVLGLDVDVAAKEVPAVEGGQTDAVCEVCGNRQQ